MTNRMINTRVAKLFALESAKRELETEIEAIKAELKKELEDNDLSSLDTGKFIVRFTEVSSNKMDTKKFKEDHSDMYEDYIVCQNYRRFSYSVH